MSSIEVCFSPDLFHKYDCTGKVVVVVDILRATTVICAMFRNGAKKVIPVQNLSEAKEMKAKGFMVVAERDGKKLDFADYGNSPFYFTQDVVQGKTIVYSTTNGTNAITVGSCSELILIASFLNISAVADRIESLRKDIIILCAGWKGKFCLEDSMFAGALSEKLIKQHSFSTICDSANASLDIWSLSKVNKEAYITKLAQRARLQKLGLDGVIEYCFSPDITRVVPVFTQNSLICPDND